MKHAKTVTNRHNRPTREYAQLLRQWMNNAAELAQRVDDAHTRHYLRAWYAAFEDTWKAVMSGTEIEIRVYSTDALTQFDSDELYGEVD